jgi:hypothetical protein
MCSLTQREKAPRQAYLRARLLGPLLIALAGFVSACGGGAPVSSASSSAMSCTMASCGRAVITITDAAGDFLAYQVTIASLRLRKSDGSLVETVPAPSRVDIATLVALTEVVTAGQIPPGSYTGASITIDFTAATIVVDDGTTNGLQVAPVDAMGRALSQLSLSVQLDSKHELEITAGHASRLAFDFNLLASNTVNATARTVTVNPVLVASVVPPDDKEMRARGTLMSVDATSNDYTINVQPFDDEDASDKGQVIVHVSDTTTFEVDGTPLTGSNGLAAFATLGTGTMTIAYGMLSDADQSFVATRVLAGSSVQAATSDYVSGSVVRRNGLALTVRGEERQGTSGDDDVAPGDISVLIASGTAVTAEDQGSSGPSRSIADISVGSRIDAFGVATRDASGHVTLDASAGHVRLEFTHLAGTVISSAPESLTMLLQTINDRDASFYNFMGTGSATGRDSDPNAYIVNAGNVELGSLTAGESVRLSGFVAPFGTAAPDFSATSLASPGESTVASLIINWAAPGTSAPFKNYDSSHIELDVSNANIGDRHQIEIGDDHEIDLKALTGNPSIVPDTQTSTALYSIAHAGSGSVDNFNSFGDFSARLTIELTGTAMAQALFAEGRYDTTSNVFAARHVIVQLGD